MGRHLRAYAVRSQGVPRPKSLRADEIAAGALAVLERDGLEALSMRSVAAELGVGTMSLYRYVTGREELEGLIVERVLAAVELPRASRGSWERRVGGLVERARDAIASHPAVVPLLLTHRHATASTVRWGEAVLAALGDAGFRGRDRVVAFRTLLAYLIGSVQVSLLGPLAGDGTEALAALPAGTYPNLTATASVARAMSADEEFRRGLRIVLRGLTPGTR
jgi:AcrR family transcriptional regulator